MDVEKVDWKAYFMRTLVGHTYGNESDIILRSLLAHLQKNLMSHELYLHDVCTSMDIKYIASF